MNYPGLNAAESKALDEVAKALQANPEHLWEVMNFESRLDPQAKNPLSSARGLVQFLDSTARGLGYASSLDLVTKNPDFITQLKGPVRMYFEAAKPYPTRQSLYMQVFFPVARKVPPDTTFKALYEKYPSAGSYAKFVEQNPGIKTVADYVNKAMKKARSKWPIDFVRKAEVGGSVAGLVLLGGLVWAIMRRVNAA